MFHNLQVRLDAQFLPLIYAMEEIVANKGTTYSENKLESKMIIAAVALTAVSIKAILDTPIPTAGSSPTSESEILSRTATHQLHH